MAETGLFGIVFFIFIIFFILKNNLNLLFKIFRNPENNILLISFFIIFICLIWPLKTSGRIFSNFYGRNSLGSIRGINEISIGGGQALGAIFSGIIYDLTQSYTLVFPTLAIMALFSALAFLFVKAPQKQ